jgi:hypothetical protein
VPSRQSRSATPTQHHHDGDYDDGDGQSVVARGVDVDYVCANAESVSTVGHQRRKEVQGRT